MLHCDVCPSGPLGALRLPQCTNQSVTDVAVAIALALARAIGDEQSPH
jgi:hypothetical protein